MENITRKAERMVRGNAKRRNWKRFVAIPAALVVFITTYALILPAIAMEGDVYCGYEAHTHTDECYKSVLACGYESGEMVEKTVQVTELACTAAAHQHTEDCFDETGAVICGYADYMVHTHNADCYDATGALVCPLPQVEAHTHDESCYVEELVNVCGQAESEGHIHTEACYTLQSHPELVCGQTESAGHVHTEACYTTTENTYLACGQEESAGHIHTEACYTTVVAEDGTESIELTCGQEESMGHTHDASCYITEPVIELTCGEEESAGHVHTEACWVNVEEMVLSCGQEESAGHTHTDECFAVQKFQVCNKPEVILHTHTDDCIATYIAEDGTEVSYLACGMTEVKEHVHTADCFNTYEQTTATPHEHTDVCYVMNLDCTLPEHVHTQECYQAPEAETEVPADETVEVPADEQIVDEAVENNDEAAEAPETEAEAEVVEAAEPALICELAEHTHDETCYDENGELVCALEEHTHGEGCYAAAEVPADETAEAPETEDEADETEAAPEMVLICDQLMHEHTDACYAEAVCGLAEHTHDESCYDENGELVCALPEHTHTADCTGLVMIDEDEVPEALMPELICGKEEHIHTAECMNSDLEYICGKEAHEHTADCWAKTFMSKTFFDGSVTVTATYTAKANIPEEAYLKAYKVTAESDPERYAARVAQANAMLGEGQYADQLAIYNIGFYIDGREIEPEDAVQVEIKFLDENGFAVDDSVSVVHFAESGTEFIEASADSQGNAASFETGSFSDFLLSSGGGWGWIEEPSFEGQMDPQATEAPEAETGATEADDESSADVLDVEVSVTGGTPIPTVEADENEYGIMSIANDGPATVANGESNDLGDFLTGAVVTDSNGKVVESGDTLYVGDRYHVKFSFKEGGVGHLQMGNGELVYHIPDNFHVEPFEAKQKDFTYTDTDNTEKTGHFSYWVDNNGDLHVKIDEPENYQGKTEDLGIVVDLDAALKKSDEDGKFKIPLEGDADLEFEVLDEHRPEINKTASSYDPVTRSVQYTVEVESPEGILEAGWDIQDKFVFGDHDGGHSTLKYESPMTLTYTITGPKGERTGTVTATVDSDGKGFHVDNMPELNKGEKLTLNYSAYLDTSVTKYVDPDGTVHWSVERNEATLKPNKGGYELKDHADVTVDSDVLNKDGSQVGSGNQIKWSVKIGDGNNMRFAGATITDTAGKGLKFDLNEGDMLTLYIFDVDHTHAVGQVEVTVHIQTVDGKQVMTYTVPNEAALKAGLYDGKTWPDNYYLTTEYTTTADKDSGTYVNEVSTMVNGVTSEDDDSVTLVGPLGTVDKQIVDPDDDGWMVFTSTVHDIPANWPNGTPFRFADKLRFDGFHGGTGYVMNTAPYMEIIEVYLLGKDGTKTVLQPWNGTDAPYTEENPNGVKNNHYFIRDYTNDNGTEVSNFYLYFNNADWKGWPGYRDGFPSGSMLFLTQTSDLVVRYRVRLTAPVYTDERGPVKGQEPVGTLRDLLDEGLTVTNKAEITDGTNDSSDSVTYTNPKIETGILKSGKLVTEKDAEGNDVDYVEYRVVVNNPKGANGKCLISDPASLKFTDTFNDYLDYEEGSLHVEIWAANYAKGYAQYEPENVVKANGNTITVTGSQLTKHVAHEPDVEDLWGDRDKHVNYGSWSDEKKGGKTFVNGVRYYGGYDIDGTYREDGAQEQIIVFVYRCKIDQEAVKAAGVKSFVDLVNNATVKGENVDGKDSCTLHYPTGQMSKTAVLARDEKDQTTNVATFTIDFNENCFDLVPSEKELRKDQIILQDRMSANLDPLIGSVKVLVNKKGEAQREYKDFLVEWYEEEHLMTISNLPDESHVVITYDAEIKVDVGGYVDVTNSAWLEGNEEYDYTLDDNFDVQNVDADIGGEVRYFTLVKKDAADDKKALEGAKFALYIVPVDSATVDPRTSNAGTLDSQIPEKLKGKTEFDGQKAYFIGQYTTRADGKVLVNNQYLDNTGNFKYLLVEYEAPTGYQLPADPYTWFWYNVEEGEEPMELDVVPYDGFLTITNDSYDYELPETGGMGTMVYTLGGVAMLTLAGAIFCGKQRRRARSHR